MIRSFSKNTAEKVIAIEPIIESEFDAWIHKQNQHTKNWIAATNYHPTSGAVSLLGQAEGHLDRVLVGMRDANDFWAFGQLSSYLPKGTYRIESKLTADQLYRASLAWGLGAYQFITYKQIEPYQAMLILSDEVNQSELEHLISSIYMVRDLINTPAEDMGPKQLAGVAVQVAKDWGANVHQIIGEDLLKESYPAIHAVGRASVNAPRLIDLRWGDEAHPKLTLVGKGVCFDTGGLNIKPTPNMTLMKKDMGGAAVVLGLARMIMALKLPVRLRVLIGAAENSISGNAIRPGDVIPTRKGITVEVNNTDAEGRLVLCDAITEAVAENPDLLIDFATLTGAARAALGTDRKSVV